MEYFKEGLMRIQEQLENWEDKREDIKNKK